MVIITSYTRSISYKSMILYLYWEDRKKKGGGREERYVLDYNFENMWVSYIYSKIVIILNNTSTFYTLYNITKFNK